MKGDIFLWLKKLRFTPNCVLAPNLRMVNCFQCKAGTKMWGLSRWQFPGMNCSRTFSARTELSVECQVYASSQEGFCWSLTLQQFGAPASVGNKPELRSWGCCNFLVVLPPNAILPAFKYPGLLSISSCIPHKACIATQKRESLIHH